MAQRTTRVSDEGREQGIPPPPAGRALPVASRAGRALPVASRAGRALPVASRAGRAQPVASRAGRARGRGTYGLDAPKLLVIPVVLIAYGIVDGLINHSPWALLGLAGVVASSAVGAHSSLRGKFQVWAGILDELDLRGDERILDVGCGRGAVLLMAARRLTTGRAVGVDLWRSGDQSGNGRAATGHNASAEAVSDRVEVITGDMTDLPFEDGDFDVVLSSIAMHNVHGWQRRASAVDEAVRVLRPGGRLAIADLAGTGGYRRRLMELGMTNVARRRLGWRMWWGGPWATTRLVTATKPQAR